MTGPPARLADFCGVFGTSNGICQAFPWALSARFQIIVSLVGIQILLGCGETDQNLVESAPNSSVVVSEPEVASVATEEKEPEVISFLNPPPEGFVDLSEYVPGILLSIGYHVADNFTGAPLPGYGAPGAWMLKTPADALTNVQSELAEEGLGLLVYDAYRPQRGTAGMVAWATRTEQLVLFEKGYIARRSGHNHGHTVDLTIVDAEGTPLDMGTPWDTLTEKSHTANASGQAFKNRLKLKRLMSKHGFKPYSKEWWHFRYPMEGTRPRDVPYGCFEAPEGEWTAPVGWDAPDYEMPMTWTPSPCAQSGQ